MSGAARTLPQDYEDPFGSAADPARYVPRDATERALADLEHAVVDQESPALLVGLPGIGKTLLLRLLRLRLESRFTVVHLPYAALPPPALASWALDAMNVQSSWDPVGALATRAHHLYLETRGAVVLLIDDAEVMSEESARALAGMVRDGKGGLRFVAAVDSEAADRLADWLGDMPWARLLTPMTPAETFQYVHTRLHGSHLPAEAIEAFDPDTLARVHERSGGIPGRVGAEASAVLLRALRPKRAAAEAPPAEPPVSEADQMVESLFPDSLGGPEAAAPASLEEPARAVEESAPAVEEPARAVEEPAASAVSVPVAETSTPEPPPPRETELEFDLEIESDLELENESDLDLDLEPAPAIEPSESVRERAAGREALARGGVETAGRDAAFERAAGRLALAHEGALAGRPGDASRAGGPSALRRWALALAFVAGCFVIGLATGPWLARRLASDWVSPWAERPLAAPEQRNPAAESPAQPAAPTVPKPVAGAAPRALVRVQINATPWARIRIDGEEVGITPLAGVPLEEGAHSFEARFPDGRVVERIEEIGPTSRWVVFE